MQILIYNRWRLLLKQFTIFFRQVDDLNTYNRATKSHQVLFSGMHGT